jgi:hypothetical protein
MGLDMQMLWRRERRHARGSRRFGVIPGGRAAEGKGIHDASPDVDPFPVLRTAGDDTLLLVMAGLVPAIHVLKV